MTSAYKKYKKNLHKLPPFVPLTWELLNSLAFKKLPYSATKALPYFIGKIKVPYNDPDKNTIEFTLTYSEAKRYGFSTTTFYRAISKLIALGFIDPASKGGLKSSGYSSSRFRLSERWKKYGTKDFKKMQNWSEFFQGK